MRAKENIAKMKKSFGQTIRKVFVQDLYVEGQKPSKSYFGDKKFFGLYIIFLLYSFLILIGINFPGPFSCIIYTLQ